jgi:hypothetical protein
MFLCGWDILSSPLSLPHLPVSIRENPTGPFLLRTGVQLFGPFPHRRTGVCCALHGRMGLDQRELGWEGERGACLYQLLAQIFYSAIKAAM